MIDPSAWPLWMLVAAFAATTAVILVTGTRIAALADLLADRTGLGEAVVGGVLLGATTSLSGSITSVVTAYQGHVDIAVGNALGGIAGQTVFLAIADVFHRKANLEHAAVSIQNVLSGLILLALLGIVLVATQSPDVTFLGIHPATPLLIGAYLFGVQLVNRTREHPGWVPRFTRETVEDVPQEEDEETKSQSLHWLLVKFGLLALITAAAGWMVAVCGVALTEVTGLSGSVVGVVFTALSTSTPEFVTAIAAVRRGALTLAVADIVGGNTFDVLFIAGSDIAFRGGSVYHAIGRNEFLMTGVAILMTSILLVGLVYREKHGIGNIGLESVLMLITYAAGIFLLIAG